MPSPVDLCNRALGEIAAQAKIVSLDDPTPEAFACRLNYDVCRKRLLRCAPWNFARKQVQLTQLGTAATGNVQFPWMFKYLYPPDCLKFRYMLELPQNWPFPSDPSVPNVSGGPLFPYYPVSRRGRFMLGSEQDAVGVASKLLMTNLCNALGVYTYDVTDVSQFDAAFEDALVGLLAEKLIMPITGNVQLKGGFIQVAKDAVLEARAMDGNEGLPTTDHTPDWIQARGFGADWYFTGFGSQWMYGENYDNMSWGD